MGDPVELTQGNIGNQAGHPEELERLDESITITHPNQYNESPYRDGDEQTLTFIGGIATNENVTISGPERVPHQLLAPNVSESIAQTIGATVIGRQDNLTTDLDAQARVEKNLDRTDELKQILLTRCDLDSSELAEVVDDESLLRTLKQVTRYDDAEWEDKGDMGLQQLLSYVLRARREDRIAGLDRSYTPSRIIDVLTLASTKEKPEWTEDLVGRYHTLQRELTEVAERAGPRFRHPEVLTELLGELRAKVQLLRNTYASDISRDDCPKEECIHKLKQLSVFDAMLDRTQHRNPDTVMSTYEQELADLVVHKALHPQLRRLAFAWTMRHKLPFQQMVRSLPEEPDENSISQVIRFVKDIVQTEVFGHFFSVSYRARQFSKMTSEYALELGQLRKRGQGVARTTMPFQFIPTRGIMMELSGYIGDACWTAQEASLAEAHPNITTIIMKQNPTDNERQKLVGSCLLIETSDASGNPVLVIRALNPIENVINRLSVPSFYRALTEYVKGIAVKRGMKVGITIDDRVGGSSTNRPLLFDYLASLRDRGLRKIPVDKASSMFNHFDISNVVYEVE